MKRLFTYPYGVWMAVFIVAPLLLVVYYSVTAAGPDGRTVFTPEHFIRFFENRIYVSVILRSVWLALVSTAICLLLGYPVAYIMAGKRYRDKSLLLFLFLVPMWMNYLLRTYAWLTILEQNGILNTLLTFLRLPKTDLLYTDGAVILGMVYNFLPFMVLPIYTVLKKMDHSLIEAAQDLGAGQMKVFTRVVFPLSLPGVVSGITMVFMPGVTTFVISNLLGGGQYILIGNLIEQQFLKVGDWGFGSAISVVLIAIILMSMGVIARVDKNSEGGALF